MSGWTTGWTPDEQSTQDYTLDTGKIKTLIKQVEVSKGLIDFLDLLNEKENLKTETQQSIEALKGRIEDMLEIYVSNINLVKASYLPELPEMADQEITYITSPLAENIFEHLKSAIGHHLKSAIDRHVTPPLNQVLKSALDQYLAEESTYIESDILENIIKQIIQKITRKLAPVRRYLDSKNQFSDFLETPEFKTILTQITHQVLTNSKDFKAIQLSETGQSKPVLLGTNLPNNQTTQIKSSGTVQIPLMLQLGDRRQQTAVKSFGRIFNFGRGENFNKGQSKSAETHIFALPAAVDLSYWCSPVKDQGPINTCTINAVASLVEYFEKRSSGKEYRASRRFLYKVTRRIAVDSNNHYLDQLSDEDLQAFAIDSHEDTLKQLKNLRDRVKSSYQPIASTEIEKLVAQDKLDEFKRKLFDIGSSIRHALKALQLFGIPPERYWDYDTSYPNVDEEPIPFCYSFAQNYQALKYFRLDLPAQQDRHLTETEQQERTLAQIRTVLAAGFPCVFGFPIKFDPSANNLTEPPNSEQIDAASGEIRFLGQDWAEDTKASLNQADDASVSGHAVLAVGYDDNYLNQGDGSKGAFLIQNSWGTDWGIKGYGWLPYNYVRYQLATNWWSLMNLEWVETGQFGLDDNLGGGPPTPNRP